MKRILFFPFLTAVFVAFGCLSLHAQVTPSRMITLMEESTTGKYYDTIPATGPAIVDINSILHIKLDLAALEDEMFRFQGIAGSDSRLEQLKHFNILLRSQNEILKLINEKFSGSAVPTMRDYRDLATRSDFLLDGIENGIDPALYEELTSPAVERRFAKFGGPYIVFVINFLEKKAQDLRESLMEGLQIDGQTDSSLVIFFRLGAFIKNKSGGRPVHVENFDDISPDAYTEISRFSAPLSPPEMDALKQARLLNDSLGDNAVEATASFRQLIKSRINNLFPSDTSKVRLRSVYQASLMTLNRNNDTKPAARILVDNELGLTRVDQFYTIATQVYQQFAGNFPQSLIGADSTTFDKTFDDFSQLVNTSYTKLQSDVSVYEQTNSNQRSGPPPGATDLNTVVTTYGDYVNRVNRDINEAKGFFANIGNMLNPFRKAYLANENFSEQVRRFTAGSIPPEGLIELKYIGERKAGDEILVKAILERGNKQNSRNYEKKEIFRRYITMARVSVHVKMSGSIVLANPYTREAHPEITLKNKFQFSPSYGIFLKWGSRKSRFYNDFIGFGAGLGFSSPDFNLDGTPEFGAGVMVTTFRDVLSAGWGWNFGLDAPYTFIGFNIPFAIGGIRSASPDGFLDD